MSSSLHILLFLLHSFTSLMISFQSTLILFMTRSISAYILALQQPSGKPSWSFLRATNRVFTCLFGIFCCFLLQSIVEIVSCFGRSQSEATKAATLLGVGSRLVAQRFPYCDGIARYLFSSPSENIPGKIRRLVSNIDSSSIKQIVQLNQKPSDIHQGVGTILVFDSYDPFTSREPYQLSSGYVASEVAANFEKERDYQMQSFLSGDTETLFTLSNIGTELFEGYAAIKVFCGGTFRVCRCCTCFFVLFS